jgi:hypothetical protein
MAVFNGLSLRAPEPEVTRAMLELAADTSAETRFRGWIGRYVL